MKNVRNITMALLAIIAMACKAETKNEIANNSKSITEAAPPATKHYVKVAVLLDTSNSMDGLIDQAKAQLWEIVNELSYAKCKNESPNLQIALFEYGNDNLQVRDGYVRKILGFNEDLDEVSKELFSLTTNGGNEFCGTVIQKSLDKLDWGDDADDLKMIFIAGNEPFTQGDINYKDAIGNAKEKGIVVNTIFCGNYEQGINSMWKDGAVLGYGKYTAIDHNKATHHIVSPYDDLILQLNIKLNGTYIPYGSKGRSKLMVQELQDSNAESYSQANAVSRTVSKSSHLYKNGSWDLVDAQEDEDFSFEEIDKKELPKMIQNKTTKELKEYVGLKKEEREAIQHKIAQLNKKRRDYISTQNKDSDNRLESAIIIAIKEQGARKNYKWEE